MRTTCLVLGTIGGLASGLLGLYWMSEAVRHDANLAVARALGRDPQQIRAAAMLLIAAMLAGIAGGLLAHSPHRKTAGMVLLAAGAVPGLLEPRAFVVTCVLVLAGFLCLHGGSDCARRGRSASLS